MSFVDHLEELRWHLMRSAGIVVVLAVLVFIKVEWIFHNIILGPAHGDFVSYKWFCALGRALHYEGFCLPELKMRFQNPTLGGQFMMSMSVSLMLGLVLAFPYILWEFWRFIKPALKPAEVKMANGIIFWCSLLFFTGVLFAYFIVAPYTINFFSNYHLSPLFENIITIDSYYDTMSNLMLAMGVVFELPIVVYFLSKLGILTPEFMRAQRRYAALILFIIAEVITPPDMFSCLFVFIPLYMLFEVSVGISSRTIKAKRKKEAQNND